MQKIGMIQAFMELKETEDATFVHPLGQHDQARLIKMRILAEKPVNLFIVPVTYDYDSGQVVEHHDDPEFVRFLAHIDPGLDQIEFYYQGSFCLRLMGGDIWLDTYDNTAFNVESVDPVSFARLWEREERDPRILEMERQARHNQMRFEEERARDRAEFASMIAEMKSNVPSAPAPAVVVPPSAPSDAGTPVPSAPASSDPVQSGATSGGAGGSA